mgnify:CR=1 FL=1
MEKTKPSEDGNFSRDGALPPLPPIPPRVATPIQAQYHHQPLQHNYVIMPTNGSATAGLVLGIISLIISVISPFTLGLCCFLSIPMAAIGALFSHIGYSRSKQIGIGNGNAVTGLILNWLQIASALILLVLFVLGAALPETG